MDSHKDLDQAALNALELVSEVRDGRARELKRKKVLCSKCVREGQNAGVITRIYRGTESETRERALWFWVPAMDLGWTKKPAMATHYALTPGDRAWTLNTLCGTCGSWWVVFPGGKSLEEIQGLEGTWMAMVYRPNVSLFEPSVPGDGYVTGQVTGDYISPLPWAYAVRIDGATWGEIAPDTPQ